MKLNLKALAFSVAILWGGSVFLTGLTNLIWPGYAAAFLNLLASIYPGYHASGSFGDMIVGTLYAVLDGFLGGLIFGWLYNYLARK
jgi:ABC-type phosphate transport system permease subunit